MYIFYCTAMQSYRIGNVRSLQTQYYKPMTENNPNQPLQQPPNTLNIPNSHNMTASIEPTHTEKQDPGIIESHTNYTMATENQSKVYETRDKEVEIQGRQGHGELGGLGTGEGQGQGKGDLSEGQKEIVAEIVKIQPIKKEEISVQAGGDKSGNVLKNTEETYAPESCQIHNPSEAKNQNIDLASIESQNSSQANQPQPNPNQTQVQIQVGVSLLDQPEKVLSQAKQERILSDQQSFTKFTETQKTLSENQKTVYLHIYQSVQRKRAQVVVWHDVLKEHFQQYAGIMKDFYQRCEKVQKEEKVEQLNKYLNIGEELKDGYFELVKFKEASGLNFKNMYEFVYGKIIKDLEKARDKYAEEMATAQGLANDKRKACTKIEDDLRKQASKVIKMFNRTKQGKKQQDDFFVQISKTIILQRQFREALLDWGRQIIDLRKALVTHTEIYSTDIQLILNTFKTQSNTLYGIQKIKYDRVNKSKEEIQADNAYGKLIVLADSDYIRASIEATLKKQVPEITEKVFAEFVDLPHYRQHLGQPRDLLTNMKVKTFNLKDSTQELINTVSGNLVLYNKETLEHSEKMAVRHIKGAVTMEQGAIEIEEKVPGIIFNSKKKIVIQFKDPDRAEELVCFIGQGDTSKVDV